MNVGLLSLEGALERKLASDARWAAAKQLVADGLAGEGEFARLLCSIERYGLDATRRRLVARRETLDAVEPILDDFFAFEAATRI